MYDTSHLILYGQLIESVRLIHQAGRVWNVQHGKAGGEARSCTAGCYHTLIARMYVVCNAIIKLGFETRARVSSMIHSLPWSGYFEQSETWNR